MFFGSHLPLAVFKSKAEGYIQAYYPLGYPLLLAAHMRSMGLYETSTVHVVVWVLLIAFVWAGAFLASQVTRPLVWAAMLPGTVFLVYSQASTGYADIPVAIFLGLAVLATGIWLERRRRADLWVACLLLAGAVQIKNEGFTGALIIMVVAGCYLLRASDRLAGLRELAVGAGGVVLLAILPWRLWLAANHIQGDHSLGKTFDPAYLVDHFKRVWPSLKALEAQITSQMGTSTLIVIALVLAVVRLRGRDRSPLSGFYLAVGLLYFLSLLAAYWTSPFDESGLPFYIETSVFRIVPGGLGFICVGAILHLSNVASSLTPRARGDTSRASPPQPPTS
jgi:4-amino-4-deoxy-L-arabinose transferase-like glycosyltransferase